MITETQTNLVQPQPIDVLLRRIEGANDEWPVFDFSTPIDGSRWFVCPTLTPLYYTEIYHDLSDEQQRRYNQLTGLCFNELIAFFESTFAAGVLAALARSKNVGISGEFAKCLAGFIADERKHIKWWHHLNRLSAPELYANSDQNIIRFSPFARKLLSAITARPQWFSVVIWIMLALEERSLDISRRSLRMDQDRIEPRYRAVYSRHLRDETRHVQMDWHLIDLLYANRSPALRRFNAKLLAFILGRFFLPPTRSAVRVIRRLVSEQPAMKSLLPNMVQQLQRLAHDPEYHEMMYSRRTTPITFALFDRFEEMHVMQKVLLSYRPNSVID
jgi:hypothetical protein